HRPGLRRPSRPRPPAPCRKGSPMPPPLPSTTPTSAVTPTSPTGPTPPPPKSPAATEATPDSARRPVRIGNSSGFYGDRAAATREMVEGSPIDVLTGDYLAELTMLILWKARQKDPA